MKKILSFLTAILFAGSMMAEVGSLYYTFLPYKPSSGAVSDYTKTGTMTIEGMKWTVPGNWYGNGALRLGGKSLDNVDRVITAQDVMGSAISKIRIAHAGKTADAIVLNSVTVTTASDADFTQNVTTKTVTDFTIAKNTKDTIDVVPATEPWATNSYYKIAFNITNPNSSNYAFVVESILFYAYAEGGGDDPEPETQTVYLNGGGSSLWNQAGAEFFAHTWGGAEAVAVKMTLVEGDVYSAAIPADNNNVVFVRMQPESSAIDWDNCWNKTEDLTIEGGNNLYTITAWGEGGNKVCSGVWSVYDDGGDDPEPPTPAVENGFYLVGTMNSWTPAAEYKFAPAEAEGEYILHTTLAENDAIKVKKVEAGQDDVWYPGGDAANYIVNAAHAGEKDIYFRPAGNEAWAEFGGFIWMGENTTPTADFTQPFTLKFNGTGDGNDRSGTYTVDDGVAGLFVAASVPYVSELTTVSNVYAGRIIAEDNSSLKFGTSSKQGTLAFTLAQAIEVDSIIVNATQYGNNAAEVTINGTKFALNAGNKVPQDCKITPEGEVTTISIAQSGSERIYLRNVRIYPKTQGGGDDPQPETQTVYLNGGGSALWNQADAEFFAHTWGGAEAVAVKMTLVKGDVYSAAIPADNANIVFVRMPQNSEAIDWDNCWNKTEDLTIEGGNNLYTITAWGEGDGNKVCSGVWSVYDDGGDTPEPPVEKDLEIVAEGVWAAEGEKLGVWAWNAIEDEGHWFATAVENEKLMAHIPVSYDKVIVARFAADAELDWNNKLAQTSDLDFNECAKLYLATAGANWCAPVPAFEHHDFFITGTANLVSSEELAWNPNAIPVDGNSYVLHLGAGTYEMKIVLDSCGASNCQQWFGCERLSGEQEEGVACSKVGNIEFALAGEEVVTVTVDLTDTIITLTGNFYNIQMVDIRLVLSPEWTMDNAKFAAVTWRDGQEMENDGVFTDWFVGTGDTVVGQIPENTDSIAFARFAPEVETPFLNPEDPNFWNHTDKLAVDPSMIFTVMGGDVEGRNFSPGYWGERPEFIADGYFLLGNFNGWTADADYWFTPYDENQYKVTVALAVDDELKVAKYDRGYRVQWFPNNADNYVVNEKHAGSAQDIYFRPDYQGSQDWYEGCIYVVDNGATAIDNTAIDAKAEKMLRNGMILIIKGDKTYNVMGQIVK